MGVSTALTGSGNTTLSLGGNLSSGLATLSASAAGSGTAGYLDVTVNVPSYLEYPWSGASAIDPTARISFGVFSQPGNSRRIIYRREVR